LEGAIHITRHFISVKDADNSGFIERKTLLINVIVQPFLLVRLKIFLRFLHGVILNQLNYIFGNRRLLASSGVQQGNLLGPLLFPLLIV